MEQTRLHREETKGHATQEKFCMADRNGWSFCSLVCERQYAVFHPWKDKMFHCYTLIEVNCTFWEFNCSVKLPQK